MKKPRITTREMSIIAMLAVCITISGMIKLPSPTGGAEFQLSSPIALIIVSIFGFKRYFTAGVVSSLISLMLGTHTIFNVIVAMTFRIVAGGIISILGPSVLVIIFGGALGTVVARFVLSLVMGVSVYPLIIAAIPGVVFSVIAANILLPIVKRGLAFAGINDLMKGES